MPGQQAATPAPPAATPAIPADDGRAQLGRLLETALGAGLTAIRRVDDVQLGKWIAWTGELVADAFGAEKAAVVLRLSRVRSPQSASGWWRDLLEDLINNLDSLEIRDEFAPSAWKPLLR